MPLADTVKPSENTRRKTTVDSINNIPRKRSGRLREQTDENGSRGDDLSPSRSGSCKKPLAKKTVTDNTSEKRAKTPIADKIPKKSVQRAKGSLALNKTIDTDEKKKRLCDVEEDNKQSTTTIRDSVDGVKIKPDRKPIKQPMKNPGIERRAPSAKKKNWATVVKKKSGSTVKGEDEEEEQQQQQPQEPQPAEIAPRESKSAEIEPEKAQISSCSFFEKLQQGVRAYFASRNSLTEEKPKKKVTEGGIRTGAGVAKGGKEETKARTQENKINNKIKISDSDLFYDRPRLKSNSGGQTNNFLNKKPKVLQYVRRKKLYHPKKHYVRVPIPRKGYFYRLFKFRPSQTAAASVDHRVESIPLPTKSEIQIARLASSGPKVSDIHKKRIKKSKKKIWNVIQRSDEFSLVSNYLEAVNFILNQQMVAEKFEEEVNRIALNRPIEGSIRPENTDNLGNEEKAISSENITLKDENLSAAVENSSIAEDNATDVEKLHGGLQIESEESYSILESQRRNSAPDCETPEESHRSPDLSFDVLMNCLKDSFGDEQCYTALEISPITAVTGNFESNLAHAGDLESSVKSSGDSEPNFTITEDLESSVQYPRESGLEYTGDLESNFSHFGDLKPDLIQKSSLKVENDKTPTSAKNYKFDENPSVLDDSHQMNSCAATMFSEYKSDKSMKTKKSEVQFAELLIGDIDLHSELQNYLKEAKTSEVNDKKKISPLTDKNDQPLDLNVEEWSKINVDYTPDQVKMPCNLPSEIEPPSEEFKTSKTDEDFNSYITNELRITRPEIDSKELPQDADGCIAITDRQEKLVSDLRALLFKKHNEQLGGDCQKVSSTAAVLGGKKSKSKLRRCNSLPKDHIVPKIRNTYSESNQFQRNKITVTNEKVKTDDDVNRSLNDIKWCPTFDELADIYSCILKHNSERKNSKKLENLKFSSVSSYLSNKQHDKLNNSDLKLIKTLKEYLKPPSGWKSDAKTNKYKKLQEYVNMFQEILTSSLSIEQITYLNGVISQLQEQEASAQPCAYKNYQESMKLISDYGFEFENEIQSFPITRGEEEELKTRQQSVQSKIHLKEKSDTKRIKSLERPKKVSLSPPTELEKVLTSTFNSENFKNGTKSVDKILVNVKVCGNRVLVNDFSYIHDEKLLYARPPSRDKVSELIIENITSDRSCDASLTDLSLPAASKKSFKKLVKKPKNIKIVLKSSKSRKSEKKLKISNRELDERIQYSEGEDVNELKTFKLAEECKHLERVFPDASVPLKSRNNTFEYDQERLKAQHPIDAIIEMSESKIIESIESNENIDPNEKLLRDAKKSKRKEELINVPNRTAPDKFFLKDLINDLGWINHGIRKDLVRTKSYNLNSNQEENYLFRENSTNDVKFLDDLQLKRANVGKKNRKVPARHHNTYFCYPSLVHEDKLLEAKKKTSPDSNLMIKKMTSKAVKKTDSRGIKSTNLKVTKETDLKMVKTNSKTVKKLDSRMTKTVNSKAAKQTDLKVIKTTNPKPVQKKNLKESMKRSDTLPTYSSQVAASERLAKKPERFSKSKSAPRKQKENTVQLGKARPNTARDINTNKNSENSLLYIKGTSDFGSEGSSINASTASTYFEEVLQQKQKPDSGNSAKSTSSSETAEIMEKYKTSPIVIFSTLDDSDGVTSQFAMIHSDSVLKTLSHTPISPTKIETVFKSHSDLKFYPGRISDSMEEQPPWVKFILTPQQEAMADLPAHQIKVVDKHHLAEINPKDEKSAKTQIPLNSIEKLIEELRENRLTVLRQKEKRTKEKRKVPSSPVIKQRIKLHSCDLSKNLAVKKQECENKSETSFLETKCKREKKIKKEILLAKVIVSILQFLLRQKAKEEDSIQQPDVESENPPLDLDDCKGRAPEKWQNLEKTTNEILNAVVNEVTNFEKLIKKRKLIFAIREELKKRKANPKENAEGLWELSKKVDALKSLEKIQMETSENDSEKETDEEVSFGTTNEEAQLVESLKSKVNEVRNLKRKPSSYFDAEERINGENEGCSNKLGNQSGDTYANTALAFLGESKFEVGDNEVSCSKTFLTPSDQNLLERKTIDLKTEEIIFSKIHDNLEGNKVYYSMALFDALLKKKGTLNKEEKLQNLLHTVNQKSKTLMQDMEKSAWMRLLYLLGEVSKMYDMDTEKKYAESAFIGSIQAINNQIIKLQNFLSQSKICNDFPLQNVFSGFLARLNTLIPRLTSSVVRFFEDEIFKNNSGCEIRTAKAVHNFNSFLEIGEKKSQLQFLKNQIRDQRLFIEYLVHSGSASQEISDVKSKVSKKLNALEKSLAKTGCEDVGNSSKESLLESLRLSLSPISSFLNVTRTFRSVGATKQDAGVQMPVDEKFGGENH